MMSGTSHSATAPLALTQGHQNYNHQRILLRGHANIEERQQDGCVTTVQTQTWYGVNYHTCSMVWTAKPCHASTPTTPCPPARVACGTSAEQPSAAGPTASQASPTSSHSPQRHFSSTGKWMLIIFVGIVPGLILVYLLYACMRWHTRPRTQSRRISRGPGHTPSSTQLFRNQPSGVFELEGLEAGGRPEVPPHVPGAWVEPENNHGLRHIEHPEQGMPTRWRRHPRPAGSCASTAPERTQPTSEAA